MGASEHDAVLATVGDDELMRRVVAECGAAAVVAPADAAGRSISPFGVHLQGAPVLRPAGTQDVVGMVRLLRDAGRTLVPLGGATGLVSGLLPSTGKEWYLSTERMRAIERIDAESRVAVVQAGVVLQTLQEAAQKQGLLFPVDLGSRGSASLGGLISTNAGGERVLRFGMMREQLLGLEVVLADGTVLDLMDEVVKNNAGYDLKQLFIGSEGTLGIVTRAVVRLRPALEGHEAAFLALTDLADLPKLLHRIESGLGGSLSAFELMWPEFFEMMTGGDAARHRPPVTRDAVAYVLMEMEGSDAADGSQRDRLVEVLDGLVTDGLLCDAAVAQSHAERHAFWAVRNDIEHLIKTMTPLHSFDVSVPVGRMHGYVADLRGQVAARWPASRTVVFGHVADNNLHVVVRLGDAIGDKAALEDMVYAGVKACHGSISAEHGVGLDKRRSLGNALPPEVIGLMRRLKTLMDPQGLLNPGKVI